MCVPKQCPLFQPHQTTKKLLYVLQFTPVHRQDADNRRGLTIDVIMDQAKAEILKTSSNLKIVNFTNPSKNLRERKFIENLRKFVAKSIIIFIKIIQGVPKKVSVKPIFEFQTLGGVFLGVKNNSKNFENKKNSRFFSKILSNWTLFSSKSYNFLEFL